ncbi:MAG: carbohydrate kinase family protein [bacterium]
MYDFIAIGDVTTDDFIHLKDERIQIRDIGEGESELAMPFREKLPFTESTLVHGVGNAPNAAVSAATLGLKSALVANVGDDLTGRETIDTLKSKNVDTQFVSIQTGKKTNYSYVLWVKEDRTILRKHEDFSYTLPDLSKPKWIYFSSINIGAEEFRESLATYLEGNPEVKFAFQPGTNEIKLGAEKLRRLYKCSEIYLSNVEEAGRVLGIETLGIRELLKRVYELGPKTVVITDGPKGAYGYDGEDIWFVTPYPDPKPPLERTGAGDAFSSTVAVALALGNNLETALKWGAVNSMSVVQEIGAQKGLLTVEKIEGYLKSAPVTFTVKKL